MAIRYDKKLNSEINKVIRNFNQKVTRLEKQGRELLPSKISKKELKAESLTRSDLRRRLKELEKFGKRGAEQIIETKSGVRVTRYELENLKRENARIKRQLTREIKRLETSNPRVFGKLQTGTFAQMGDSYYLNLQTKRKALDKQIDKLNFEEYERLKKLVKKTGDMQTYMQITFKENYYKMLTDMAYYYGYNDTKENSEKLNELKDKLFALSPQKFLKLFREDKSIEAILFYYPISTGNVKGIKPPDVQEDVRALYDNLIDNIDDILNTNA